MEAGRFIRALITVLAFSACSHELSPSAPALTPVEPSLDIASYSYLLKPGATLYCKAMLDSYCTSLYSPAAQGNLAFSRGPASIEVHQGETPNQFSEVYYSYSMAKIRNRRALPADLQKALEHNGYFTKLALYLGRRPREKMTLPERIDDEWAGTDLRTVWGAAMNETVLARVSAKYPGFHAIPDESMPIEWALERRRIQRSLVSEVSRAIWRDDKNWKKVEEGFSKLRASFLHVIDGLAIDESVRQNWSKRIREVTLVLPGSLPSIATDECATTNINAYYYTHLNLLTVCAGDFNSEDILQTVAHEMAHALDVDRSLYLYQQHSEFGQHLAKLRENVCAPEQFSCEGWSAFKNEFDKVILSLRGFRPEVPEFQRCLHRRPVVKELTEEALQRVVQDTVASRLSDLASSDSFLRITKKMVPYRDGKSRKNPNFLNPCNYSLWSSGEEPVDDALSTMIFFTAEYRCSDQEPAERMRAAIELSKRLSAKLLSETIRSEGEFSDRFMLEKEGYASSPVERFADVLGSYATADLLRSIPQDDRKGRFLASSSWQCTEPSLASHFPEESSVESQYVFDSHTEGDQRRKELFSAPIREALGCKKDFEFNECSLPLRH